MKSNRRRFLGLAGGSLATLTFSGCRENDRLTAALLELNEAAAIGVTPDEFERARAYATGVYREAQSKLRSMVLREDLELSVQFSPRNRQ